MTVGIRFYIPPDPDADPTDADAQTPAEQLQQTITKVARIKNTAGNAIVEFNENKGTFLTPRGRYTLTLYDTYLRMHGARYDYQIKYDDISRLFLLPKPDDVHMAFVIALDKPIRQGQQRYQILVLQTTKEQDEVKVNLDSDTLQKEYDGQLDPIMTGSLCNLIAKTFKVISKKKVFVPGKFESAYGTSCVKCALRANEGFLYPLEKSFVFIHKPPVLIRFDEVDSVEFQRYAGGQGSTRNFDLSITLSKASGETAKEYVFSGIDRADFDSLYNFLSGKKIRIINTQDALQESATANAMQQMEVEDEDSEDDEDFGSNDESGASSESGSDSDDSNSVEMVPEDEDSDLEEMRKKRKKSNDSPPAKKSKSSGKASPKKKKKKDPNAPKRGLNAYMFFSKEMRPKIMEENPGLGMGEVGKLLGQKYKELTDDEKAKYDEMAAADKTRYEEEMETYEKPEDSGDDNEDESVASGKKKKKKAKKDPNAPKNALTAFMFFNKDMRHKLKEDNPDLSFGDLGRLVGEKFKALTDEEKAKYNKMSENDKERYTREKEAYDAKKKAEAAAASDNDSVSDDDSD